jgi:hypothetical protein
MILRVSNIHESKSAINCFVKNLSQVINQFEDFKPYFKFYKDIINFYGVCDLLLVFDIFTG